MSSNRFWSNLNHENSVFSFLTSWNSVSSLLLWNNFLFIVWNVLFFSHSSKKDANISISSESLLFLLSSLLSSSLDLVCYYLKETSFIFVCFPKINSCQIARSLSFLLPMIGKNNLCWICHSECASSDNAFD